MAESTTTSDISAVTMRKVGLRLVPLLMICYFVAYLDRVNVGFAALTMKADTGISDAVFGFGAALFFVAYVLFEVPSNLAMNKVGARIWIARIMVSWGVVGIATAFVTGPYTFYIARFLLGAAEAGFFPGVIFYITCWFPKQYRARVIASFMVAVPISNFLGSPLSGVILEMNGWLGLHGWQWVFILESIPAVLLALVVLLYLPNTPQDAKWLSPKERRWLAHKLDNEQKQPEKNHGSIWAGLVHPRVLALAVVYAGISATSNSLSLWQPQILKSFGLSTFETSLLNMIPFGVGSIFMIIWAVRADKANDRVWSTALPLIMSALCLVLTNFTSSLTLTLLLLSLTLVGNFAVKGPFWAFATERLSPAQVAGGIAAINSLAHLGTGGITWLIGVIKGHTDSFPLALLSLATLIVVGIVILFMMSDRKRPPAPEQKLGAVTS